MLSKTDEVLNENDVVVFTGSADSVFVTLPPNKFVCWPKTADEFFASSLSAADVNGDLKLLLPRNILLVGVLFAFDLTMTPAEMKGNCRRVV